MSRNNFVRSALADAIPIMAGYFPIAMAFGILANSAGVTAIDGVLTSVMVYAGASQFMAVSMLASGIGPMSIVFAVLFMNFRHFIMSASVRAKLKYTKKRYFPIIGFFLTDETYSIISLKDDVDEPGYLIPLEIFAYLSWVGGTAAGYAFGSFIPKVISESMGIALYALLLALLIPAYKKEKKALVFALCSGIVNTLLVRGLGLDAGLGFVIAVVAVSAVATFRSEKNEPAERVVANDEY